MSGEKHTPGPWKAEVNEKSAGITILGKHGDPMRCRVSDGHGAIVIVECQEDGRDEPFAPMLDEQVANARLIAAAPELVEALTEAKAAIGYAARGADVITSDKLAGTLVRIDAALTKAGVS